MFPALCDNNFRVITPDLIGFGKSDKRVEQSAYSYQNHIGWLEKFIEALDLQNINLFCQDWGDKNATQEISSAVAGLRKQSKT